MRYIPSPNTTTRTRLNLARSFTDTSRKQGARSSCATGPWLRGTLQMVRSTPPIYSPLSAASPTKDKRTNNSLDIIVQLYNYLVITVTAMQNLDSAFSALSDPTRRAILARLAMGETTV